MARRYSDVERANLRWFVADDSVATLRAITIRSGEVRGLKKSTFQFDYPITAIAGKNGCGKSTVISLAACAFHNKKNGWHLPDRKTSYYTFSEFFIQAHGERPLDGIHIRYQIHHDNWLPSPGMPEGRGIGWQSSIKRRGGRWTDYDNRVDRPVAYFGIERVVPSSEKSVFRSYRHNFSVSERSGFEEAVCRSVSRVLGVPYDIFEFRSHGKYRLPWVQRRQGAGYSGFNMGAGEKALFEFFAAILSAPKGALFLVDEIELGLHDEAQASLIRVLSDLCIDRHIQIICTTHSAVVLSALPPEGRMFIESSASGISVIPGISSKFASGKLSGKNSSELTVYVEDAVAAQLLAAVLQMEQRSRIDIVPIGSHAAVVSAMAARFKDARLGAAICFLDGDQRAAKRAHVKKFIGACESRDGAKEWFEARLFFLPGNSSPEVEVLSRLREIESDSVEKKFGCPSNHLFDAIDNSLLQGDHNEMILFARAIHQDRHLAWRDCCNLLQEHDGELFDSIREPIEEALKQNAT